MWRGTLCPRRVIDLVEQGPDDSAFAAALRGGPEHRAWTLERHLQAMGVDAANTIWWVTAQSNSKKKVPRPKPVQRPVLSASAKSAAARRVLDLSKHPLARRLPEKYRRTK